MGKRPHVAVLVLGDVGRSPRMQYHALSLAALPCRPVVHLIGYGGSPCFDAVERCEAIQVHRMEPFEGRMLAGVLPLFLAAKFLALLAKLLAVFLRLPRPELILVQNPPALPALGVAYLVARLRRSWFVIDWHNLGFTLLAEKHNVALGPTAGGLRAASGGGLRRLLVAVYRAYEAAHGRLADRSLCVTNAMAEWLVRHFRLARRPITLYDRPPRHFRRSSASDAHSALRRLDLSSAFPALCQDGGTPLTTAGGQWREDRPLLIVSSTSWTPDEDFSLLLRALERVDALPGRDLLVVITGKGPQRALYEGRMRAMRLRRVRLRTAFLPADDYPLLLGAADLGVCMHRSSSGLDLPMKVLDMFGAGLPVCAAAFEALPELVEDGATGAVFPVASADAAAQKLAADLQRLSSGAGDLERMASAVGACEANRVRWEENWNASVGAAMEEMVGGRSRPPRPWVGDALLVAAAALLAAAALWAMGTVP